MNDRRVADGVDAEQLGRLVRVTLPASIMGTLGALILAVQFMGGPSALAVVVWLAVFALVAIARLAASLLYRHMLKRRPPGRAWDAWAVGSTLVVAALWGLSSLLLPTRGSAEAESLMHVILVAVAMGAAMQLSGRYPLLVVYVLLVLGPLTLRDLHVGGGYHLFLGALSTLIGLYTLFNGRDASRMIEEILAQRRRNAELIEALHRENERTEAARASAERANAARARFFVAANHDLRQPLNAMGLLAQTLDARGAAVDVAEVSGHLVECVDSMTQVVDELLDISRLDVGQVVPTHSWFALDDLLREVVRTHRPLAGAKGLRIDLEAEHVFVPSDRTLLARVLANLLSNAIRYTERGGVRVSAALNGTHVDLSVTDTGRGIAPDELSRIFEEFYQVGNPARDRRLGLGLGLSTAKRLSDLLGLELSVQSTPGSGSRFGLRLPRASAGDAMAASVPAEGAAADALLHCRVLVIEDDADSRVAMLGLLGAWGCEAQAVADTAAALERVAAGFEPHAALIDLRLAADARGVDALVALRGALGDDLPALLVTGDVASEQARAARTQGHMVLAKPIKAMALRAFLAAARVTARGAAH